MDEQLEQAIAKIREKKSEKQATKQSLKLTPVEQRELELIIRRLKGNDFTDIEIIDKLGILPHIYRYYVDRIKGLDRETYTQLDNVSVYADFVEKSRENIRALDKMQKRFDYKRQYTALVTCVKQKHEINKDLVKMGQTLGFIEERSDAVTVEQEMSFSTMSTSEVEDQVSKEMQRLNTIAKGGRVKIREELMDTLGGEVDDLRESLPAEVVDVTPVTKPKKTIKVKTKVKLKKKIL